ncbi:hypothetical protein LWI29_021801 [Acer saccharum]|uniref:SKP1-like protein n=1 Tax=Acer saccharum TaxID=4024 RepID=A0AA39S7X2_ACESA|nr:hypothetical protein LWI29_021801 [Acer saccharum]KAK1564751.1 hypothetical protein Q3G72_010735 [Acer saccharum]
MASPSNSSSTQAKKIKLESADGVLFEVEEPMAMEMETVKLYFAGNEDAIEDTVMPLPNVLAEHMPAILDFYSKHLEFRKRYPLPPTEEVKAFDDAFLENKSNDQLKELIKAANYLNSKELLDFLTNAAANRIKNKSVEYVRAFFGVENDFTPKEEAKIRAENKWAFEGLDED